LSPWWIPTLAEDVVEALKPYLKADPDVRIYETFQSE